ncbi:MAG: transporter substrate-binding domain-containing protein [Alphaproteobacteria bacterium]|nr:transporter substrate-binding domain-containing protein [Alphaproteobacteria bacterium]
MIRKFISTTLTVGVLMAGAMSLSSFASADELADIKKEGKIKIAMSGAYPPFNFVDDQNNVVGFDPAIGKEIARRMGVEAEVVTTAWDGILAGLMASKYDAIVGSMSITEKRLKVVDFVGPYYRMSRAVFVREDSDVNSLADLEGKKVGATLGETHEKWVRKQDKYELKTYKGLTELLLELENNRVDAIVVDNIPVLVAVKKNGMKIRQLDTPNIEGADDKAGIAVRKGNPELMAAMQKALDDMMADGTYTKIAEKWIGADIR